MQEKLCNYIHHTTIKNHAKFEACSFNTLKNKCPFVHKNKLKCRAEKNAKKVKKCVLKKSFSNIITFYDYK